VFAAADTVVVCVAVLLSGYGSGSVALTVAALETVPGAMGVMTIVTVVVASKANVPRLHVTVVVPEQVPCLGVAETNITLGGRVSVIVTLLAENWNGPKLLTLSV
jgi:hypothetical protein